MNKIATTKFDYKTMPKADRERLLKSAASVRKTTAEAVLKIGKLLSVAQAILAKHKTGSFVQWLDLECRMSTSTAYRCIKVHEQFGGRELNFPNWENLEASALYVLSSNGTEDAIEEAVELASNGQKVTRATAKKIVEKHTPAELQQSSQTELNELEADSELPESPELSSESTERECEVCGPEHSATCSVVNPPEGFGKCPNCAGSKWVEDPFGAICKRCGHAHGEPVGDPDDDRDERIRTQRSKTVKTAEALMRAFDDLHQLQGRPHEHAESILLCKTLLKSAQDWK